MTRQDAYLLVHVVAAVIWVGGGTLVAVLAHSAGRDASGERLRHLFYDLSAIAPRVFAPAAGVVVLMGLLLVLDGPWSFGSLWIVIGLVGFAASFAVGKGLLEDPGIAISKQIELEDGVSPASRAALLRLLTIGWIDTAILLVVVADMVLKPTGDDVGILVAFAAVIGGTTAAIVRRLRTLEAEAVPVAPA